LKKKYARYMMEESLRRTFNSKEAETFKNSKDTQRELIYPDEQKFFNDVFASKRAKEIEK